MKAKIRAMYDVSNAHEISVDYGDCNYLIIYGKHCNGWFIAMPNWKVSVEAANPNNVFYNTDKLVEALSDKNLALALAKAIQTHWETINYRK